MPAQTPLRLLVATPSSPLRHGGVERHVLEVTHRLRAAGVEIEVLCSDPGGPARTERLGDVPLHVVPAWPADRDWRLAPGIWRGIARGRWDIVHVQSYHTFVAPLAMIRALCIGVPYVVTFHGGGHSSGLRHRLRGTQRRVLGPLLRRAARLVAVARFEIDEYGPALGVPAERFALIPNGVEVPEIPPSDRGSLGSGDEVVIATIGRLERYKGHHRVIEALPEVVRTFPRARLLVVGSGPYEADLRRRVDRLGLGGRVEFTQVPAGDAAGMGRLLSGVDLVALLSEFETHPLTGLEAAAAHRRLIVAATAGLRDLAGQGLARAVPLELAPDDLGAAMVSELHEPPPCRAVELPSWDDCASSLLALYADVIGAQAGRLHGLDT